VKDGIVDECANADEFVRLVLEWHKDNNRNYLFWRKSKNPYHILIAEIMLQKTTALQVQSIIEDFLNRFPTPKDLAKASVEEIKELITPLGMEHKRAVRFKKLAKSIVEKFGGEIPDAKEELLSLPGVGQYIANSVLCTAFGKDEPLVDTNIVRVLERVFNIKSRKKRPRTDEMIWNFVKRITPPGKSRDLNLALLDFGALVCTARKPKCVLCPVSKICLMHKKTKKLS
jgi:A/G-specific adenine glycosylase